MPFGKFRIIKSGSRISDGKLVLNYNEICRVNGVDPQDRFKKYRWLLNANLNFFYIEFLRKLTNSQRYMYLMRKLEKLLFRFYEINFYKKNDIRVEYEDKGYLYVENSITKDLVLDFCEYCKKSGPFIDVYNKDKESASLTDSSMSLFYVQTDQILKYDRIIELLCNDKLIEICESILGKNCSITWFWSWFTPPSTIAANQKWHRDSSEPFNFIRVFIPLTNILTAEDGPTEYIPASQLEADYIEPRRYTNDELFDLIEREGVVKLQSKVGDIYLADTYGIHRGTEISSGKMRGLFSLLVSLSPSYRTSGIPKLRFDRLSSSERGFALRNKKWLKNIVEY